MRDMVHEAPHTSCDLSGNFQLKEYTFLYPLEMLVAIYPVLGPHYLEYLQQILAYVRTREGACPAEYCRTQDNKPHHFCTFDERMIFSYISHLGSEENQAALAPTCVHLLTTAFPQLICLQWLPLVIKELGYIGTRQPNCGRQCFNFLAQFCDASWLDKGDCGELLYFLTEIARSDLELSRSALDLSFKMQPYLRGYRLASACGTIGRDNAALAPRCYEALLAMPATSEPFEISRLKALCAIACRNPKYAPQVFEMLQEFLSSPSRGFIETSTAIDQLGELGISTERRLAWEINKYLLRDLLEREADKKYNCDDPVFPYTRTTIALCSLARKYPEWADELLDRAALHWDKMPLETKKTLAGLWRGLLAHNGALFKHRGMTFIDALMLGHTLDDERRIKLFKIVGRSAKSYLHPRHCNEHSRESRKEVYLWAAHALKQLSDLWASCKPADLQKERQSLEDAWWLSEVAHTHPEVLGNPALANILFLFLASHGH